jgi:hypothetical protein
MEKSLEVITKWLKQFSFNIRKSNRLKVGMNVLNNRFHEQNNVIPLDLLNLGNKSFKIACKNNLNEFALAKTN